MCNTTRLRSMADVQAANQAAGQFWFSPATMAYFQCRIESDLLGGTYFITSEQEPRPSAPRLYTVRRVIDGGASIETVGEFQQHPDLASALGHVSRLLPEGECRG